ncbi:MAG: hypothetical protein H0U90_03915 [Actinobacteria bacterium]|nr:hypothetical protein [Actinomycetota bacterium]
MTREIHHERTLRLLEVRLETLAEATERSLSGQRPLEHRVLAIEAATRHAVELDVLTTAEARRIWAEVGRRHPDVAWCRRGCPGLAA